MIVTRLFPLFLFLDTIRAVFESLRQLNSIDTDIRFRVESENSHRRRRFEACVSVCVCVLNSISARLCA